ncbi:hypothetical protein [Ktedonospora formicarum]|uniref:Uncharacterized protein n=1 Tax=Ktedonospora formicarum TaxID=2778364 RepID=A0A8J3HWI3_9CHLR|nr:hypothetical protein [Ktedonospora formicarum]GHO44526.1 hypothetical protein KSX_26890 [Ktedonospora formicarum]
MSDWLSPSNIIGVIGIFSTILVAVWVYFKEKTKKELTYQFVYDIPVVSVSKITKGTIEVTLDGKPVKDARVVVIKVWNSGNREITKEDYDTPVSFEFLNRDVISGEVLSTEPEDLMIPDIQKVFLRLQNNTVIFPEYLLNKGESIRVSVLTSGAWDNIKQRGRIIGGNILYSDFITSYKRISLYYTLGSVFALLLMVIGLFITISIHGIIGDVLYAVGLIGLLYFGWQMLRQMKRDHEAV